jgi:hypothetical protein
MTAKPLRETVMENIRLKITIRLNRNHALSAYDLESLAVNTIAVTRIKDANARSDTAQLG